MCLVYNPGLKRRKKKKKKIKCNSSNHLIYTIANGNQRQNIASTARYHIICSKFSILWSKVLLCIHQTNGCKIYCTCIVHYSHYSYTMRPFFVSKLCVSVCVVLFSKIPTFDTCKPHTFTHENDKKDRIQSVARGNTNFHLKTYRISISPNDFHFAECSSFTFNAIWVIFLLIKSKIHSQLVLIDLHNYYSTRSTIIFPLSVVVCFIFVAFVRWLRWRQWCDGVYMLYVMTMMSR